MIKIADITLTVGVSPNVDTTEFQNQIKQMVNGIEPNPQTVTITADTSGAADKIKSLQEQIDALSGKNITIGVDDNFSKTLKESFASVETYIKNIQEDTQNLSRYITGVQKQVAKFNVPDAYSKAVSQYRKVVGRNKSEIFESKINNKFGDWVPDPDTLKAFNDALDKAVNLDTVNDLVIQLQQVKEGYYSAADAASAFSKIVEQSQFKIEIPDAGRLHGQISQIEDDAKKIQGLMRSMNRAMKEENAQWDPDEEGDFQTSIKGEHLFQLVHKYATKSEKLALELSDTYNRYNSFRSTIRGLAINYPYLIGDSTGNLQGQEDVDTVWFKKRKGIQQWLKSAPDAIKELQNEIADLNSLRNAIQEMNGEPSSANGGLSVTLEQLEQVVDKVPLAQKYIDELKQKMQTPIGDTVVENDVSQSLEKNVTATEAYIQNMEQLNQKMLELGNNEGSNQFIDNLSKISSAIGTFSETFHQMVDGIASNPQNVAIMADTSDAADKIKSLQDQLDALSSKTNPQKVTITADISDIADKIKSLQEQIDVLNSKSITIGLDDKFSKTLKENLALVETYIKNVQEDTQNLLRNITEVQNQTAQINSTAGSTMSTALSTDSWVQLNTKSDSSALNTLKSTRQELSAVYNEAINYIEHTLDYSSEQFKPMMDALFDDWTPDNNVLKSFQDSIHKIGRREAFEELLNVLGDIKSGYLSATEAAAAFSQVIDKQFSLDIPNLTVDEEIDRVHELYLGMSGLKHAFDADTSEWSPTRRGGKQKAFYAVDVGKLLEQYATDAEQEAIHLHDGLQAFWDAVKKISYATGGAIREFAIEGKPFISLYKGDQGHNLEDYLTKENEAVEKAKNKAQDIIRLREALTDAFNYPNSDGTLTVTLDQLQQIVDKAPVAQKFIDKIRGPLRVSPDKLLNRQPGVDINAVQQNIGTVKESIDEVEQLDQKVASLNSKTKKSSKVSASASELDKAIPKITKSINALSQKLSELGNNDGLNQFIENISEISGATGTFAETFPQMINNIDQLNQKLLDLGNNEGINKFISDFSEISGSTGTFAENMPQITSMVEKLASDLQILKDALASFQGVNIDINIGGGSNSFQRTAIYGQKARQSIIDLKAQASELENVLKQYYHVSDGYQAVMKAISGTDVLKGRDIFGIFNKLNDPSLSLNAQMDAVREYIKLINDAASTKGIDLSSVTSSFSASADQIVEDTRKIATGEADLRQSAETLKSLFGSSLNSEELNTRLTQINESIGNVVNSISTIGESLKTSSIEEFKNAINSSTEAINKMVQSFEALKNTKLQFDTKSAEEMRNQIDGISKAVETAVKKAEDAKAAVEGQKTRKAAPRSDQYKQAAADVRAYYDALDKWDKTKGNDITFAGGKYTSASGNYKVLADVLNQATAAYNKLGDSMKSLPDDEQVRLTALMTSEMNKRRLSIEETSNAERKLQEQEQKRAQTEKSVTKKDYAKESAVVKDYYKMMTTVAKTSGHDITEADGKFVSKGGSYQALADALNRAKTSYDELNNSMKSFPAEKQSALTDLMTKELEKYSIAAEKAKRAEDARRQAQAQTAISDQYKQATADVKAYYSALATWDKTKGNDITFAGGKYTSESGNYQALADVLNQTSEAYNKLGESMKSLPENEQRKLTALMTEEENKRRLAVEESTNAERKRQAQEAKRAQAAQAAADMDYSKEAATIKEYYKLLTTVANTKGNDITEVNGQFTSTSGNYQALADALNRAKAAYDAMNASMSSFPGEKQSALLKLMAEELEKYSIAAEKAKRAEDERAQKSVLTKNSKAQIDALTKVSTLLKQVTDNTRKWSAASKGDTKAAYDAYKQTAEDLNNLYNSLQSGTMSAEEFNKEFGRIKETVASTSKTIAAAGKDTTSFGDRIKSVTQKFASWFGVSQIIMGVVRVTKEMIQTYKEVESSLAQLRIVTGATDSEMESFFTRAVSLAKELGQSVTDVTKSLETFSRLGYNLPDASELSKYATILSNVANVDVETATTGLTSIIKGYSMDVSDAEHVADVLTQVGQKYAISAEELMAAFQRGGAALYASGTDFEKSAALFAATNASLQNAESVGTMFKTDFVFMYRNVHMAHI